MGKSTKYLIIENYQYVPFFRYAVMHFRQKWILFSKEFMRVESIEDTFSW